MSAYDLILSLFVLAIVGALVVDHRRGWLTGLLVDSVRFFHSSRLHSSERPKEPRGHEDR